MQNTVSSPIYKDKQIRLAVSLFYFTTGLVFSSWASRIPTIKNSLQISEGELGMLLLVMPIGEIATMALVGKLIASFGSKNIFKIGILSYAATLIAIALAPSFWTLAVILTLFGICSNACNIAINTQGVDVEKIYNRSIMSSFHGAWSLAGFTGALIGLILMYFELSILNHFIIIFILIAIIFTTQNKFLIDSEIEQLKENKGFVKPDKVLIQLGVIGFLGMATEGTMFDWSGVYFDEIVQAP